MPGKASLPKSKDECQNCTPDQLRTQTAAREKNLLRDLIDHPCLCNARKDDNINVEGD